MGLNLFPKRVCVHCYGEYTPRFSHQLYCCKSCRLEHDKQEYAESKIYKDPTAKFQPVLDFMQKYYEETGKYIQYGKAVAIMEQEKRCQRGGNKNIHKH